MHVYPTINKLKDRYDIAYTWGWNNPELKKLVYFCYKTPNLEDNARRYWKSLEFQEALRILSELAKKPNKDIRVLDFGCGNGIASYALARSGYHVIGVDSSLGEIAGLNAAKKIQNLDGIEFELKHSTGEKISFRNNSFDIVWMREVLHHIEDLSGFLAEIKRILKPGGALFCLRDHVIWNEEQYKDFFASHPFNAITQDEGCYYLSDYLDAFKNSGMIIERVYHPYSSVINTYPRHCKEKDQFDEERAKSRKTGNDLFSFFVKNQSYKERQK